MSDIAIPPFYTGLGASAVEAYRSRKSAGSPTCHWSIEYHGVTFWFWKYATSGGKSFNSQLNYPRIVQALEKTETPETVMAWLNIHSFNTPL